ncbi:cytochrome P450 [Haloferacaceae archaeon DSL9]
METPSEQQFITLPPELATPAGQRDPFPWFRAQHEAGVPLRYDEDRGSWDVFGHAEVKRILGDPETFTSENSLASGGDLDIIGTSMINSDPPRHTRLRSMAEPYFNPAAVRDLEPEIEAMTRDLLDEAAAVGELDVVEDLAYPLPVLVIAELLGVPSEDRDQFRRWSLELVGDTDEADPTEVDTTRAERIQGELGIYFTELIEERKEHPRDDLISALIEEDLDEWELLGFCALLLVAGNITTTNLLTNAVRAFDEYGDIETIRANLRPAIEEVVRYRSPVQAVARYATRAVDIAGETIEAGDHLNVWLAAANHDPAVFDDPATFDPTRRGSHVGFGHGIHYCLGAHLARLEAKVVLSVLYDRYPDLEVVGDDHPPVTSSFLHGRRSLPVRLDPPQ